MPIDHRQTIAAEVRAEMARQRKTHQELADVLGFTKQAVSIRLRGLRSFRAEELVAAANWLDVPVSQFAPPAREGAA